jgi:hypothetical protein
MGVNKAVAITGRIGAGKTTIARHLQNQGAVTVKFADPLKAMIRALLKIQDIDDQTIERMVNGDLREVPSPYLNNRTPRYAMQTLGTEWGRLLMDENLWVDIWSRRVDKNSKNGIQSITDDLRFPNEEVAIRKLQDSKIIKVVRAGHTGGTHPSETNVDVIVPDFIIQNDGSIESLHERVDIYLKG